MEQAESSSASTDWLSNLLHNGPSTSASLHAAGSWDVAAPAPDKDSTPVGSRGGGSIALEVKLTGDPMASKKASSEGVEGTASLDKGAAGASGVEGPALAVMDEWTPEKEEREDSELR